MIELSFVYEESNLKQYDEAVVQTLGLLPNITSLSLGPPPLALDLSEQTRIDTLCLDFSAGSDPNDLKRINALQSSQVVTRNFWIPTLRRLHVIIANYTHLSWSCFPRESYRTSPITELYLTTVARWDGRLGSILRPMVHSVEALRCFSFVVRGDNYPRLYDAGSMLELLESHASTLVEIHLVGGRAYSSYPLSLSLSKFVALKRLAITNLFDHQMHWGTTPAIQLPASLEEVQIECHAEPHLSLQRIQEGRYSKLKDLACSVLSSLSALRTVIWWNRTDNIIPSHVEKHRYHPSQSSIADAFEEVGVEFDMSFEPSYSDTPFGKKYSWNRTVPL